MREIRTAAAALLALALAMPALAQKTITVGMSAPDIGQVDPHKATTTQDKPMTGWMFNGLVRYKPGSGDLATLEPDLAEKWTRSPDGLVWTFTLRKGVKFHRGFGELTADDVVFSLNRAGDAKASSFSADYRSFAKVEAVDPLTVRITLKEPVPSLLHLVANFHGGNIVSKKAVEQMGDDFKLKAIGTGPFMVDEYKPKESITFVANKDYFRGAPKLDRIVYRFIQADAARDLAFQSGEIDVIYGRQDQKWVERMKSMPGVTVDVVRPAELTLLHFNIAQKPLDDIRVRRAIATAIDNRQIVKFTGEVMSAPGRSVVPIGYLGFDDSTPIPGGGDAAKAKQMLADAGFPNGITLEAGAHQPAQHALGRPGGAGAIEEGRHRAAARGRRPPDLPRQHPQGPLAGGLLLGGALADRRRLPDPVLPFALDRRHADGGRQLLALRGGRRRDRRRPHRARSGEAEGALGAGAEEDHRERLRDSACTSNCWAGRASRASTTATSSTRRCSSAR